MFAKSSVSELVRFMEARHDIYLRRERGEPAPWTTDPILAKYRFCNVYRELDNVTKWVTANVREPFEHHEHLWFFLSIARQINHPGTLQHVVWPVGGYDAEKLRNVLRDRAAQGQKVYTGAYMLNCNWGPRWTGDRDKATFTTQLVLQSVWDKRSEFPKGGTLQDVWEFLQKGHGWGSFMAAQVVADLKYAAPWRSAADWWSFATPGPGSLRGMEIVLGRHAKGSEWRAALLVLRDLVNKQWQFEPLHAQDMQNVLCEYSKYCRGYSRSKYVTTSETN